MPIHQYEDLEFGDELPEVTPDVSMPTIRRFGEASGMTYWRFTDHEKARAAGLPGAIVPGIMSQGILVALIHRWAPSATVHKIDTIFIVAHKTNRTAKIRLAMVPIDIATQVELFTVVCTCIL